jgi:hypothetical protein
MLNLDGNLACDRCKLPILRISRMFTCRGGDYHGRCWQVLKRRLEVLVAKAAEAGRRRPAEPSLTIFYPPQSDWPGKSAWKA